MTAIATVITLAGILALLAINHNAKDRTSPALWLVVVWVAIATSRPVSAWLQMAPDNADLYMDGSPLDRAVFTLLLALGLVVLVTRHGKVTAVLSRNLPLILFYSYCGASILWSDYPDITLKRWIKGLGDVVMVLIVLTERDPTAAMRRLFARVAFAFVPLSFLFIRYYGELGREYSRWEGTVSYTGIAADKNMLGMACLIFGLALFWRWLQDLSSGAGAQKSRSLLANGVVLIMLIGLLVISNSMTALGCFILAIFTMIAVHFEDLARRRIPIHILVVTIIATILLVLFVDIGHLLSAQIGRNPTLTGRTELWPAVIALAQNPLLGTGFESFWLGQRLQTMWQLYWWRPNQAHNGYLEIYLNLGWVGLGLLALLAIRGYQNIIKLISDSSGTAKLRLAFFVVAIAYNFTEAAFKTLHPVWLAFLLAVIVPARAPISQTVKRTEQFYTTKAFEGARATRRRPA